MESPPRRVSVLELRDSQVLWFRTSSRTTTGGGRRALDATKGAPATGTASERHARSVGESRPKQSLSPRPGRRAQGTRSLRSTQRSRLVLGGRASRRAVDLSDGAHVVGEVCDAARHPSGLDITHLAWRAENPCPRISFATEFVA